MNPTLTVSPLPIPSLYMLVLLPVVVGALGYFTPKKVFQGILMVFGMVMIGLSGSVFYQVRVLGQVVEQVAGWQSSISIMLKADQISAPLVLLTNVLFFIFFMYSTRASYMDKTFQYLFMTLQTAVQAMFLSWDLFNIYVVMEVGMLAVSILIMFKKEKQSVYDGMMYLMINFLAMAFMILGLGYMYRITGVLDFATMREKLALIQDPRAIILPYTMIMTVIALKSALFPLFSWLPRAHGAPSAPGVISAVLSGLQVKIGVYLLIRLQWVFEPVIQIQSFFAVLGFITAIVGFLLALAQKDMKLLLAYSTVSQMGLIVLGLNAGTSYAFWGGMYHIINHALFKGLLFITAGTIIDSYGTKNLAEIRGVFKQMPLIGIAAFAGVLGIIGTPLFNGSVSKYLIQEGLTGNLASLGIFVSNLGTVLVFIKYSRIFFGSPQEKPTMVRDPFMELFSLVLGLLCLLGGIFGGQSVQLIFGESYSVRGALSTDKFLMFFLTLGIGLAIYQLLIVRIDGLLQIVRKKKLYFTQIGMLITLFFVVLTTYMYMIL
jgi:multicomponent Na+:H+ antiporter subunit D